MSYPIICPLMSASSGISHLKTKWLLPLTVATNDRIGPGTVKWDKNSTIFYQKNVLDYNSDKTTTVILEQHSGQGGDS